MKKNNKNYSEVIPKALKDHIKKKFNCSSYLANECTKNLISKTNEI